MAIFNQRAELNKQKRHISASWDDSFGNKLLGFNEKGGRNVWGRVMSSMAPGLDTATHAIAKKTSTGSTKDVLEDTFDETVNKDFSKLAFGAQLAKTIMTFGAGSAAGAGASAAGGAGASAGSASGGGMGSMFSNMFGKGGGSANSAGSATGGSGGGIKSMFGNMFGKGGGGVDMKNVGDAKDGGDSTDYMELLKEEFGGDKEKKEGSGIVSSFRKNIQEVENENLKNPFSPGTPEYMKFEEEKDKRQKEQNKGAFGEGAKRLFKDSTGGNIIESGANLAGSMIARERASKYAIKDAQMGQKAYDPTFNYL